jgi:hypothetical protein
MEWQNHVVGSVFLLQTFHQRPKPSFLFGDQLKNNIVKRIFPMHCRTWLAMHWKTWSNTTDPLASVSTLLSNSTAASWTRNKDHTSIQWTCSVISRRDHYLLLAGIYHGNQRGKHVLGNRICNPFRRAELHKKPFSLVNAKWDCSSSNAIFLVVPESSTSKLRLLFCQILPKPKAGRLHFRHSSCQSQSTN